ncbi:hypothetical protein FOXYSP1_18654 [Fusarium oxysporum f. sp. phaseoli]
MGERTGSRILLQVWSYVTECAAVGTQEHGQIVLCSPPRRQVNHQSQRTIAT